MDTKSIAKNVSLMLKHLRYAEAINCLNLWAESDMSGSVHELIAATDPNIRDKFKVLLLDVLSGYPNLSLGLPILIYSYSSSSIKALRLENELREAAPGIAFHDWLHVTPDGAEPIEAVFRPKPNTLLSLIAVLNLDANIADPLHPAIPTEWLSFVLETSGHISLSTGQLASLPCAMEAAHLSTAVAYGKEPHTNMLFLSDSQWFKAWTLGEQLKKKLQEA